MAELCPTCTVIYQNANADVALQQQQFNSVLAQGAKVVVLDPVDSTAAASLVQMAHDQGVKVIAYDRPIPDTPADYYVSFDNEGIGAAIAQSLVDHLKAEGVPDGARRAADQRLAHRRGGRAHPRRHRLLARRVGLQDAGRVRHAGLGAAGGAAVGVGPDHPLRRRDQGRGRGQRRHRRRRHRGVQGGRRRSGAAGDGQRRDHRGAAAHHRGRPVQHDLQALRDRGARRRPKSPCSS